MNEEPWHTISPEDVIKRMKTDSNGLGDNEAKRRLSFYGLNELKKEKGVSRLSLLLGQFNNFLVIILLVATVFSAIVGEIVDAVVIMVIVLFIALFGFFQEYKAEKAVEALKRMTNPESVVIRNGRNLKIKSSEIVPGDIVVIEEGTKIPADLRLIEVTNLKIDEAALTGESFPVLKNILSIGKSATLGDRKNMAYMGTIATYGRGLGVVIATGMNTEMGKIAKMLQEEEKERTPLQEKLDVFGKRLGMIIIGISVVVIILSLYRDGAFSGNPIELKTLSDVIIFGISLAIAAVPEGLAAVVTITLALGLNNLSKENALVKRLSSVETLGSTTVICTDKTGTLTMNEMIVNKVWTGGRIIEVTGKGYDASGDFLEGGKKIDLLMEKSLKHMLTTSALCNNAHVKAGKVIGDPTEAALLACAYKAISPLQLEKQKRVLEIPFSSSKKMMSTVNREGEGMRLHTKGAPEKILELCTGIYKDGRVSRMTPKDKKDILEANRLLTGEALRVLAIAYRDLKASEVERAGHNYEKLEKGLVFLGLMGMMDPPRKEVKGSIDLCKQAGIKVVMITGDHQNTALEIAKELGIAGSEGGNVCLNGEEMSRLSDKEFDRVVGNVCVYARVNPEDKVRIVEALKRKNHVVAMTGDGVNDAPAVKAANVGVSMGIKGTDVTKEASDIVLSDDNFTSIVSAVRNGRTVYDNIKKFVKYLLTCNISEVFIVLFAMIIGFTDPATGLVVLPFTAIQLLWINLLTDGPPAIALGVDPPSRDVMKRKPRNPKEDILSRKMTVEMLIIGFLISVFALLLFYIHLPEGLTKASTMVFAGIVMYEMVMLYSVKVDYNTPLMSNKKLMIAVIISILLQLFVVYTPFMQGIFNTTALNLMDWGEIILTTLAIFIIVYIKKKVLSR